MHLSTLEVAAYSAHARKGWVRILKSASFPHRLLLLLMCEILIVEGERERESERERVGGRKRQRERVKVGTREGVRLREGER